MDKNLDKKNLDKLKIVGEWAVVLIAAFVLSLLVRHFLLDVRVVPSESMVPSIEVGDRLVVDRLFYKMGVLERGDIIVFSDPLEERTFFKKALVKRLIGLPGETVEVRDGYVWIDGQALNEPYVNGPEGTTQGQFGPVTVPEGFFFMMGDNRQRSSDSRAWGMLDQELVMGRVWIRLWPFDRLGSLTEPPADYYREDIE